MTPQKTIGLVLGSGSSRGWAHIGAIEALTEEGIPIDCIAGCSVGSYVGAIFASGGLSSLKSFVLKMDGKKVFSYFDVVFPRAGLLDGTKKVKELFSLHSTAVDFSDLAIPLMMVATDLERGEKVVLGSGSLLEGLRATMSFPGLFSPARVKNRWLVDGGLVDPVPVGVARTMGADIVIAVDLNNGLISHHHPEPPVPALPKEDNSHREPKNELMKKLSDFYASAGSSFRSHISDRFRKDPGAPDIVETVMDSIGIMQERITRINLAVEPPDILVQPRLGELKMMDFDQVEHTIQEGYLGMKEKIEDIKTLLASG